MGHIVFGTKDNYKEFAWMFPHIRCLLLDHIKPFRSKLIAMMKDGVDLNHHLVTSDLFQRFDITKPDVQFLMTCAMIFTGTVIMDRRITGNLPTTVNEVPRLKMLEKYCRFPDAHKILLTFCTYTALSRSGAGTGKTRVQFSIYRR